MINKENWYNQADICRKANNSETLPFRDVLVCQPYGKYYGVYLDEHGNPFMAPAPVNYCPVCGLAIPEH